MSGGTYNQFWVKLSELNYDIEYGVEREDEPIKLSKNRQKLLDHLKKLEPVLKTLEWVDSGDSVEEALDLAIEDLFKHE